MAFTDRSRATWCVSLGASLGASRAAERRGRRGRRRDHAESCGVRDRRIMVSSDVSVSASSRIVRENLTSPPSVRARHREHPSNMRAAECATTAGPSNNHQRCVDNTQVPSPPSPMPDLATTHVALGHLRVPTCSPSAARPIGDTSAVASPRGEEVYDNVSRFGSWSELSATMKPRASRSRLRGR
ncbi:hypothetical protein DBV15_09705 [Temnothorax longispinosus]|uniref:Uncharacterized protein n=1 Tax=Temnothorax longispinosus TaxID=300112 RepID=A0A4S2LCQ7_9HYME|nr:hypothetical protein DBV15_09705 [Temnothorax longispinosus]